ncbi:hypothetical protein [Nocardia caishijiensis]|uniref:DUF2567 domain-containing protein n=1 Tax=Nocardia caishijiensis TaxID=184756 RepID=A0ABQ6YFD7_9NOCA|nr:hypothetical protein [Nocardia caishijiensis]KAF0836676.1 hypothetical protein FNL39_11384 [Nocardia caishijiensis]
MYPAPVQRPPSGGTAILTGISALVGGLVGVVGMIAAVGRMVTSDYPPFGWGYAPAWASIASAVLLVVDIVAAVLLLIGAIVLFRRKSSGPMMVASGCAGVIGAYVAGVIITVAQFGRFDIGSSSYREVVFDQSAVNSLLGPYIDLPWFLSILLLVFPAVTLLLALLPSTRRWCGRGNRPAWAPAAPGMPYQHPGLPQAPGYAAPQAQWAPGGHHPRAPRPQDGYR